MSTFYLDYEGGSDAADGLSFANRWKTLTLGATAARIAPGDTVRIMGSPAETSLAVNGTWTDGPMKATVSITSSTNATPIEITKASHGLTTGDTIVITGHTTNTYANGTWEITSTGTNTFTLDNSTGNGVGGATGTYRVRNNGRVKLASAVTKSITRCDLQTGAWTASANVTCTTDITDYKDGYGSCSIDIAAGFTTGLAAYRALSASTDFSAYKQISFWIKQVSGTVGAAGACTITLCSDTAGVTAVDTFNIPAPIVIGRWFPVTVDKGSALGAAIQSVAFNVVTDNGAQKFLIDCPTACKDSTSADSLSLQSLIGKNTGTETWCAISAIQGTRVMLDQGTEVLPTSTTIRGYSGTTETVTAYKKETIKTAMAVATLTTVQQFMDTGSLAGGYIYIEGGWNRTDMSTQTLETWFDGLNGFGQGLGLSSTWSYMSFNKLACVRYNRGMSFNAGNNLIFDNITCNNNSVNGGVAALHISNCYIITIGTIKSCSYNSGSAGNYSIWFQGGISNYTMSNLYNCDGNQSVGLGVGITGGTSRKCVFSNITARNNGAQNITSNDLTNCIYKTVTSTGSAVSGILITGVDNIFYDLTSSGNTTSGINATLGRNYLVNASIAESTEITLTTGNDAIVYSQTHDTTTDNHQIFTDGGLISSDTTTRHTASGLCWKFSPTSATRTVDYPLRLTLAKILCTASTLVTVKAWMRRSNTGLTMKLVCKGGQIGGVASDVTSSMTAAADTYEELTITFTPTADGTVEITAEAYGGTAYNGYVDDLTISQA